MHVVATGKDEAVFAVAEEVVDFDARSRSKCCSTIVARSRRASSSRTPRSWESVNLVIGRGALEGEFELWNRATGEKQPIRREDVLQKFASGVGACRVGKLMRPQECGTDHVKTRIVCRWGTYS